VQRFELVAGASAKFWVIERVDVAVTVRFGRIGTAGQAQQKSFATAPEAEAHRAKLVAGKTKKGHEEALTVRLTDAGTEPDVSLAGFRYLNARPADSCRASDRDGASFGALGPVAASEILRDLTEVTS
jgi:predicted DNA-binding WGR domain protein